MKQIFINENYIKNIEGCATVVERARVMVTEWKLANIPGGQ